MPRERPTKKITERNTKLRLKLADPNDADNKRWVSRWLSQSEKTLAKKQRSMKLKQRSLKAGQSRLQRQSRPPAS